MQYTHAHFVLLSALCRGEGVGRGGGARERQRYDVHLHLADLGTLGIMISWHVMELYVIIIITYNSMTCHGTIHMLVWYGTLRSPLTTGSLTLAPRTSRYIAMAFCMSGTAMATWFNLPSFQPFTPSLPSRSSSEIPRTVT